MRRVLSVIAIIVVLLGVGVGGYVLGTRNSNTETPGKSVRPTDDMLVRFTGKVTAIDADGAASDNPSGITVVATTGETYQLINYCGFTSIDDAANADSVQVGNTVRVVAERTEDGNLTLCGAQDTSMRKV